MTTRKQGRNYYYGRHRGRPSKRRPPNFSKVICFAAWGLFALSVVVSLIAVICSLTRAEGTYIDLSAVAYIVPPAGAVAGAAAVFYYNKAKAENLSKQRVRYVLIKQLLRGKLDAETYTEVCDTIDSIDQAIESKLAMQHEQEIAQDVEAPSL